MLELLIMLLVHGALSILLDEITQTTGDLLIDGGVIVDPGSLDASGPGGVLAGDQPAANACPGGAVDTLDVSGCVVTPGLVNAHHHLLQSAFRTLPGTRGVSMAEWLPTMAAAYGAVGIDPELVALAAAVGLAESLLAGVTTVADHHLTWPAGGTSSDDIPGTRSSTRLSSVTRTHADHSTSVEIARATADAAAHLGARLVFVRGTARDDPQEAALSVEQIVAALVPGAARGIRPDGMLQVAVGPAGVHSDSRETFTLLADVAARHGLRRRTQANEQVDVAIAAEKYGSRPVDLLDDWGWIDHDVTLAHLCGITPDEIRRLATAGVSATHAPGCDLPMGWGIAPVVALRDAGVTVGLGTSGGGSNDAGNLLADARLAMQVAPLVGPALPARAALALATRGSALGLGRPELGSLTAGSAADLCAWDVTGVADAGVADPAAGLLWANPGRRPRHVVIAGRVVVRDYELVTADEHALAHDLTTLLAKRRAR